MLGFNLCSSWITSKELDSNLFAVFYNSEQDAPCPECSNEEPNLESVRYESRRTEVKILRMCNVAIDNRPWVYIPPRIPIPFPIPGEKSRMIPLPNDNRSNSRSLATHTRNSLLYLGNLKFLDPAKLALCHTIPKVKDPNGEDVGTFFVEGGEFGDHGSDTDDDFFAVVLVLREGAGVLDAFEVDTSDHCCETRAFGAGSCVRYVGADEHLHINTRLPDAPGGDITVGHWAATTGSFKVTVVPPSFVLTFNNKFA